MNPLDARLLSVFDEVYKSRSVSRTAETLGLGQEAVVFLGVERTRSLILLAGVFTQFEDLKCPGFSADAIWSHSLQVAAFARTIAMVELKDAKAAESAYTAGLVHDMGKLILAANVPTMCSSIESIQRSKHLSQRDAELQVLGTTHAELAACLLGMWGLPLPVLDAVAWHHCPLKSDDTGFSVLAAVHAANVFAYENVPAPPSVPPLERLLLLRCSIALSGGTNCCTHYSWHCLYVIGGI